MSRQWARLLVSASAVVVVVLVTDGEAGAAAKRKPGDDAVIVTATASGAKAGPLVHFIARGDGVAIYEGDELAMFLSATRGGDGAQGAPALLLTGKDREFQALLVLDKGEHGRVVRSLVLFGRDGVARSLVAYDDSGQPQILMGSLDRGKKEVVLYASDALKRERGGDERLAKLEGKLGVVGSLMTGEIYNGSDDFLKAVVVEVVIKRKSDHEVVFRRKIRVPFHDYDPCGPLSSCHFQESLGERVEKDQAFEWTIDSAEWGEK